MIQEFHFLLIVLFVELNYFLSDCAVSVSGKIEQISNISTGLVEEYIVKLETRIKELLKTDVVDQTRLAQEVVIYSDKCSVEEELTRLRSHIGQFLNLTNENRKLATWEPFIKKNGEISLRSFR